MHERGYTWDGMLPLRKRMAKLLVGLGLPVAELKGDDTDRKVTTTGEVERGGNLFGIEKPDWNEAETLCEFFGAFAVNLVVIAVADKHIRELKQDRYGCRGVRGLENKP